MSPTEFTHSPVIPIAAPFDLTDYPELAGINNLTGTGLVARISAGVYATRTLTGTTNQVNVADGNGVAGNPTISLPQNIHTAATPTFAGMTLSGMTAGSVLFAGTSGVVSQDNSNLYWDDSNDRLGIGTASPSAPLDIIKIGVPLYTSNNDPTAGIREYARFVGGNNADGSGARLVFNDNGGYTDARNRGAIGWSRVSSVFGVDVYAGSSLTQAARFTSTPSLLVNTTTDSAHYRLKVNGAGIFGSNLYDANFATLHVGQRPLADSIATIKLNTQTSNRGWHLDVFDDGTTAQYFQIYSSVSAATRLKITHAGNFLFGGATETASSGLIQLATGTTAATGILWGTDTNLYRSAANTLKTDDTFRVATDVEIIPAASANRYITLTGSNGGNPTISVSAGSLAITPATVFASTISAGVATLDGVIIRGTSLALTNSFTIGPSASVNGINSLAIGSNCSAVGDSSTAIGRNANTTAGGGTSLGVSASAGSEAVAIGVDTVAGSLCTSIGKGANTTSNSIAIGKGATTGVTASIAIGINATTQSTKSIVIGSPSAGLEILDSYFGTGEFTAVPYSHTIHASGGLGTDIAGANLGLAGGRPTGAGAGGYIFFSTAVAGLSSSTIRNLVERMRITSPGNVLINTTTDDTVNKLQVAGTISVIGGATLITTSTALTDGAGAGAGTLTNAPAAGDPTKWIGINDNGTTRYIPAW